MRNFNMAAGAGGQIKHGPGECTALGLAHGARNALRVGIALPAGSQKRGSLTGHKGAQRAIERRYRVFACRGD